MNILFWLLIIIGVIMIWFLGCSLFKPLGKLFYRIFNDAVECLNEDDKKDSDSN